jgi:hypothetical protein
MSARRSGTRAGASGRPDALGIVASGGARHDAHRQSGRRKLAASLPLMWFNLQPLRPGNCRGDGCQTPIAVVAGSRDPAGGAIGRRPTALPAPVVDSVSGDESRPLGRRRRPVRGPAGLGTIAATTLRHQMWCPLSRNGSTSIGCAAHLADVVFNQQGRLGGMLNARARTSTSSGAPSACPVGAGQKVVARGGWPVWLRRLPSLAHSARRGLCPPARALGLGKWAVLRLEG